MGVGRNGWGGRDGAALPCFRVGLWSRRLGGLRMWEAGIMRSPREVAALPWNIPEDPHIGRLPPKLYPTQFYALKISPMSNPIFQSPWKSQASPSSASEPDCHSIPHPLPPGDLLHGLGGIWNNLSAPVKTTTKLTCSSAQFCLQIF
jgi:hypothetical protein